MYILVHYLVPRTVVHRLAANPAFGGAGMDQRTRGEALAPYKNERVRPESGVQSPPSS